MARTASFVDYQERASGFAVGDVVLRSGGPAEESGKILALYPAIGMADVEWAHGSKRDPVEDLVKIDSENNSIPAPPVGDSVPGGANKTASARRVAEVYVKQAVYWREKDRQYKATRAEQESGKYGCPKKGCGGVMRRAVYKRRGGQSERLLGCPKCLTLVKPGDIDGCHLAPPPAEVL